MLPVGVSHFSTVLCLMLDIDGQLQASKQAIYKRKLKFLTNLQHSENTLCKLFKYIIDELDIVHKHLFS